MDTMCIFLRMLSLVCVSSHVWSHSTSDVKTDDLFDNFIKTLVIKHDKELSQLEDKLHLSNQRLGEVIGQSNKRQEQLEEVISQLTERQELLLTQVTKLSDRENASENVVSSTYTRWGRKVCPTSSGAELVYTGYAAGADFDESGGGSNYVCLTETPQWKYTQAEYIAGKHSRVATLHGAEYQFHVTWPFKGDNIQSGSTYENDVPCAVCETAGRSTVLMIPGTYKCPGGWQEEYQGYLSASCSAHYRSEFVCVDGHPEALPEGSANLNGALFYYAIAKCGALPCPPYINDREVTCVVCSK